jgi:hypothetical protein
VDSAYHSSGLTPERAATTTILFSDLVGSTELMQRAGDDDAQRIFKAHYQLLRDAVSANGGAEVKSLGDGLMVAFASTADAVRCAISMQQASRRPVAASASQFASASTPATHCATKVTTSARPSSRPGASAIALVPARSSAAPRWKVSSPVDRHSPSAIGGTSVKASPD